MKIQTNFYTLVPYTNLLYIETFSAWDDRVVKSLFQDFEIIKTKYYKNQPWAMLTDCRDWSLSTPEGEGLLTKEAMMKSETTLTHQAIIVGKSKLKKWQVSNAFGAIEWLKTMVFSDMQEGKDWLESFGYHMAPLEQEK